MTTHEQDDLNDERKLNERRFAKLAEVIADLAGMGETLNRACNAQANATLAAQDELAKVRAELAAAREELGIERGNLEACEADNERLRSSKEQLADSLKYTTDLNVILRKDITLYQEQVEKLRKGATQ